MKFPRPQHQEPSEFGGGSGAEVGSADQAPRTSAPTRAPRHNKHPTNKYTNEKNNNAKAHALHRHVFNGLACCLTERSGVSRSTRARRRRRSREVAWISYAYDPMFLSKTNVTKKKKRRERIIRCGCGDFVTPVGRHFWVCIRPVASGEDTYSGSCYWFSCCLR